MKYYYAIRVAPVGDGKDTPIRVGDAAKAVLKGFGLTRGDWKAHTEIIWGDPLEDHVLRRVIRWFKYILNMNVPIEDQDYVDFMKNICIRSDKEIDVYDMMSRMMEHGVQGVEQIDVKEQWRDAFE